MAWDREKERKAGKAMTLGGCIYTLVFMIFWCAMVAWMDAWFMLVFGLFGLGFAIARLVLCIQMMNKQKPEKPTKEIDPWDRPSAENSGTTPVQPSVGSGFCPYCGSSIQSDFEYCPKCGRKQG